ncbi:MAG TPA: glycosyltransferase [Hanamia sp.]|nr:glycosyltransferase [Hanamia sp.]
MSSPLLSVCFITYNHEKYIEESLESILNQRTSFDYEIVIGEDFSTDRTREIVFQYEKKYPEKIRVITGEYNVGSQKNILRTLENCSGKYIAAIEGDDYWTDNLKLQKQVDFLEKNIEYSMVCHDALKVNTINNTSSLFFGPTKKKQICSTKDALNVHFCPTASIVFRKQAILPLSDFNLIAEAGDQALVQFLSLHGLLYRMYDVMSVYRKTATGASEVNRRDLEGSLEKRINSLNNLNKISDYKYQKYIRIENLLIKNRIDLLRSKSKVKTKALKVYRKILSVVKKNI